jgi:hypothetical protein
MRPAASTPRTSGRLPPVGLRPILDPDAQPDALEKGADEQKNKHNPRIKG